MTTISSFQPIIDHNSKILILGSIPGVESLTKGQYYGNPRNHFWKIIFTLLDEGNKDEYADKIAFMREKGIALWDVINQCERIGSLDANIKNEEINNFNELFKKYPNISFVAFNGSKAYESFKKYVGFTMLQEKNIKFEKLPSTSPIPGKHMRTFEEKVKAWQILKSYLETH